MRTRSWTDFSFSPSGLVPRRRDEETRFPRPSENCGWEMVKSTGSYSARATTSAFHGDDLERLWSVLESAGIIEQLRACEIGFSEWLEQAGQRRDTV
jgi:hypothetical protein